MKKLLIFIVLLGLVGGGIYYFAGENNMAIKPSLKDISKGTTPLATRGQVLGESIVNAPGIADLLSTFNSIKSVVQDPAQTVEDITTNVKERLVQQFSNMLGLPTSTDSGKDKSGVVSVNNTNVVNTTVVANGFEVCSAHKKNEIVDYLLEFSSSTAAAGYVVDWGDGGVTQNSSVAGSRSVLVSHLYAKEGSYTVKFKLAGSAAILAQKEVCVQ